MERSNLLTFKGKWRSYQRRILDNLEFHLADEKLHIVAAPGAGKTTLGIEVIARINRPSLILCPTNTIKNQWKERICSAFLEEKDYDKVSTNIRKPAFITVTTYQALLAAFCEGAQQKDNEEKDVTEEDIEYNEEQTETEDKTIASSRRFSQSKADEIIKILKYSKISLLCFDEAHHLRNEWWKALNYLIEELSPEQMVSLTATPPYDADINEWQRYEELCGPIDEVISIPELVKNGDLCPHQDIIYFSLLKDSESEFIKKHNRDVAQFIIKLTSDTELLNYLSKMNFLTPDNSEIERIYDCPEFYVSAIALLNAKGYKIPKDFLKLFGTKNTDIPKFSLEQVKAFLNGFLITKVEEFKGLENKIKEYENSARHSGILLGKKIVINENPKIQKQIANSTGKTDAVKDIVETEINNLGENLRMVILADYIKADDNDNTHPGVVPIWRKIKDVTAKIGILCGTLIVIPKETESDLQALIKEQKIQSDSITIGKYKEDEKYIKITPKESAKHNIVSLITELFNRGHLTILIGTQALLGEGWDAPVINSLILSSTVSSYMLSNQMRGRAIRKDKNNPNKISNIWHLATVSLPQETKFIQNALFEDNINLSDFENYEGFYDIYRLQKRFEGFEAPSYYKNHEITSGTDRILTPDFMNKIYCHGQKAFTDLNKLSISIAKDREQTKKWWDEALYSGYNKNVMTVCTGIQSPFLTTKTLIYSGYKHEFVSMALTFGAILYFIVTGGLIYPVVLGLWLLAFIIGMGYIFAKFLKTGSASSVMKQIAIVHLETMWQIGLIKTSLKQIGIKVSDKEQLFLSCSNLPTEENNLLIKSMQEFLDPVNNPRYILVRESKLLKTIKQTDYFSIPTAISTNKKNIQIFQKLWEKHIGDCKIVYTRNTEGRKLLLKARTTAFSANKRDKTQRLSKWQ